MSNLIGLAKYRNFTEQERTAFYARHNLSSHPDDDLIELARNSISWCKKYGAADLEVGDLDWMIEPLKDLDEYPLLNEIMMQKGQLGL